MSNYKIFNLYNEIEGYGYFSNTPLSKADLGRKLSTSRPSIKRFENVVYVLISEFKSDYPELPKEEWLKQKTKYNRKACLSPYQIWVISLYKKALELLGNTKAVEGFVKSNPYLFTREKYCSELQKLAQLSA
ncbi:MAG: hypothetical protein AAF349_06700 [Cyanobacteria bacterium P01_A01_bin.68]